MIPDYSIELCFRNDQRERVRAHLAQWCDPDHRHLVEEAKFDNRSWDAEICLLAPSDASAEQLHGLRKLADGSTLCGIIDFTYAPQAQYIRAADCFSIEIWPRTKRLQFIFFSSMKFRTALVDILKECHGMYGLIVYESSFPIIFWTSDQGRINDDRPERTSDRLLVPAELNME